VKGIRTPKRETQELHLAPSGHVETRWVTERLASRMGGFHPNQEVETTGTDRAVNASCIAGKRYRQLLEEGSLTEPANPLDRSRQWVTILSRPAVGRLKRCLLITLALIAMWERSFVVVCHVSCHHKNMNPCSSLGCFLRLISLQFIAVGLFYPAIVSAQIWHVHNPSPPSHTSVDPVRTGGDGRIVGILGDQAALTTSADGTTWQPSRPLTRGQVYDVVWGSEGWVTVAKDLVLNQTFILKSSDAITWTSALQVANQTDWGLAHGAGKYWLVSRNSGGAGRAYSSANGSSWTDLGSHDHASDINRVVYDSVNNLLIIAGGSKISSSSDALAWTANLDVAGQVFRDAFHANGATIVIGSNRDIYRSTTGTTWTPSTAVSTGFYSVTYGSASNTWLALNFTGGLNKSTDNGTNWISATGTGFTSPGVRSLAYNSVDNLYYAGGMEGLVIRVDSPTKSWTDLRRGPRGNVKGIAEGNNRIVVLMDGGNALTSSDGGATWVTNSLGTTVNSSSLMFHNGAFYAFTSGAKVATSSDGINWTLQSTSRGISRMIHDGTRFVAFEGGSLYTSSDAVSWTQFAGATLPGTLSAAFIRYSNGVYLLFEANSGVTIHTSTNLLSWQSSNVPGFNQVLEFAGIDKIGSTYYHIQGNSVIKSTDLRTWSAHSFTGNIRPEAVPIVARGARFYAIGESTSPEVRRLIYTDDAITWQLFGDSDPASFVSSSYSIYTGSRLIRAGEKGFLGSMVVDLPIIAGTQSFSTWASANSLPTGQDGPTDDPDNDNVSNMLEFALGTNPNSAASYALPSNTTVTIGMDDYPAVKFTRKKDASGVTILVQAFDSIAFTTPQPTTEVSVVDLNDGTESVTIRANTPTTGLETLFFRTSVVGQ
jgi:hypothetical protein